jgi:hypothetical protein
MRHLAGFLACGIIVLCYTICCVNPYEVRILRNYEFNKFVIRRFVKRSEFVISREIT